VNYERDIFQPAAATGRCTPRGCGGEDSPDGRPSQDAVTRALTMAVEAVNA